MDLHQRGPGQELDHKVAVADRVQAVLGHACEAQVLGQGAGGRAQRVAGQRSRPERQEGGPLGTPAQPPCRAAASKRRT